VWGGGGVLKGAKLSSSVCFFTSALAGSHHVFMSSRGNPLGSCVCVIVQ